jgi:hypothetical protein
MELKNQGEPDPKEAAHDFVGQAEHFLAQYLGREFDLREMSDFVLMAGATLLGSMYAILRKELGKEKSEKWINQALSVMTAHIRMRGADALVTAKVTVKDMPNKLSRKEEAPVAVQPEIVPPAAAKCSCSISEDGICHSCVDQIGGVMENAFSFLRSMIVVGKKTDAMCPLCKERFGDRGISRIVPGIVKAMDLFGKAKEEAVHDVMGMILQMGGILGVTEMPLTQDAFKKALVLEK